MIIKQEASNGFFWSSMTKLVPPPNCLVRRVARHPAGWKTELSKARGSFLLHSYIYTLQQILLLCTSEVPFYDPHGYIFIQKDGPIFSNFYISALENKVFDTINKPNIYLRYADVILILTNSTEEINNTRDLSK